MPPAPLPPNQGERLWSLSQYSILKKLRQAGQKHFAVNVASTSGSKSKTLRNQTRLIFGIALTALIGVLYAASSNILLGSLKKAEEQDARQLVRGVLGVFAQTQDDFSSRLTDWAAWDDTYKFIQDANKDYIKSNLIPEALATLKINLVLYIQPSGQIVFGTGFDLIHRKNTPIPEAIRAHLSPQDLLLQHSNTESSLEGIVLLPEGLMMISSRPILTSEVKGPIRGTLIFGRFLDTDEIARLSRISRLHLTVYPVNETKLPPDFQAVRDELSNAQILVRPLSAQTIAGYTLQPDIYGKPALILRVDIPREIYTQGQSSLHYLIGSLLVVGLVFAGITLPLLERLLVFWHERQEREQRYRAVVAQASEGIFLVDADTKFVLEANAAFQNLLGYTSCEVLRLTLYDVVAQHREKIDHDVQRIRTQKNNFTSEWQYCRKNGSLVDVEVSTNLIFYDEKDTLCIVLRDITERKRAEGRLRAHYTTTHILAESSTIAEATPKIIQAICESLGWDLGELWLVDRQANVLRYVENWHKPSLQVSEFEALTQQITFSPGVGLPGRTWVSGQPTWITDITHDANFLRTAVAAKEGLHGAFGFPILSGSETFGVLTFFSHKLQQIDEDLLKMIATIGSQIGQFAERKRAEEALRESQKRCSWQATHDSLTELVNRREFEQRLEQAVISAKTLNYQHALCYLDLDRFNIINDTYGHVAGDELLRQVSTLFQTKLRKTDILARLGGDEFGVLFYQSTLEEALDIATRLQEQLHEFRFRWQDKTFSTSVSIGLVDINADTQSLASVLSAADAACYAAKNKGRNRVHIYQVNDTELAQQRSELQWIPRIQKALEENHFRLYYQRIVSIHTETKSEHCEILLRLEDETGIVPPMAFIPAAERYQLMHLIDRWVISTLFAHLRQQHQDQDCSQGQNPTMYAINLSGASINDAQFLDFVQEQFALHRIPASIICFEITETVAITNLGKAAQFVRELKALGCYFALDDFGSGMSSFAYLKNLPVDYLKIDGVFIKDIVEDAIASEMVKAIARIASVMKIQTIAEFVENDDILMKLRSLGVDYAQGYGIAQPCPL